MELSSYIFTMIIGKQNMFINGCTIFRENYRNSMDDFYRRFHPKTMKLDIAYSIQGEGSH